MSTQQDIYAASSENRSPMLNKDNYVPWSSRSFFVRQRGNQMESYSTTHYYENGPLYVMNILKRKCDDKDSD
ncbi:hypothetical protein Tco_0916009 [Tanacetum coccineum]